MAQEFEILKSYNLQTGTSFMRPSQVLPRRVSLTDAATSAMTDLSKISVVVTRPNASMDNANAKMIRYGVRMLLVLNSNDQVAGLLTANDLMGEKPMRFLQNMGGTYADIMVSDLMTPQRELEVMRLESVKNATVGQIVATLKKCGRQHGLVVNEGADGKQAICGLFSTTQIARQLGLELTNMLAEIESVDSLSH